MDNPIEIRKYKSLKDNKELRKQAMMMFMSGKFYPTEIADRLCIDIDELGLYVFGRDKSGTNPRCWHHLKTTGNAPKFLEVYEEIKPMYIKKTEKKLLDAINETIDHLTDPESDKIRDFDTKDLSNLISSMEKIDKIGRLEEGRATSHTVNETKSFSLRELDNFKDIEDAEYREV